MPFTHAFTGSNPVRVTIFIFKLKLESLRRTTVIIRQATVEDIHILQTFEKKLRTYYKTIGETVQVKRRSLEQIEKRIKGYLIAEINGKPVGTIYYKESVGCLALSHF